MAAMVVITAMESNINIAYDHINEATSVLVVIIAMESNGNNGCDHRMEINGSNGCDHSNGNQWQQWLCS